MREITPDHRKQVVHHHEGGIARELTFSCYRRFPLLWEDEPKRLLSQAIDRALAGHHFQLVAFVYMPEHVHLIVFPLDNEADVSGLLSAIKKPQSFRVKQWMTQQNDPWLGRLLIRERPQKAVFRFWQEGTGFDRNLVQGRSLRQAIDYLHNNPVRRRLAATPDQWPWSSWHYYHAETMPPNLPHVGGMPETDLLT